MVDNRTPRLDLPLPNVNNYLEEDVGRLEEALTGLDAKVATVGEDGKLAAEQIPDSVAMLDVNKKLPAANLPPSAVQTGKDGKISASVVPADQLGLASDEELDVVAKAAKAADDKAQSALEKGGNPVLAPQWIQKRAAMWTGYAPADGQLLPRSLYPDAVAGIQAGMVPVCTEAEWLADPTKRGCFTLGDGSTNFRLPDYNGRSDGAIGTPVFRGDGKNAPANGILQGDAIRNITYSHLLAPYHDFGWSGIIQGALGAIDIKTNSGRGMSGLQFDSGATGSIVTFDASRVVPVGPENRMVNLGGCWAIRLFGSVQNVGSADAAALATAVAALASRITALEARKSTCLVNAAGTGAPHETVVAQLPATVTKGSKYVLPNPFGNNVPVDCRAEIFVNGKWGEPGWMYSQGAYGARALYSQGEGIVIVTGGGYLVANGNDGGNNFGALSSAVTSAPCRVFVRKLEA